MSRMENWSVKTTSNPYTPPEHHRKVLVGEVHGDSRWPDGHGVVTSRIKEVKRSDEGITVVTKSGSEYLLGEPCPDYEAWCRENEYEGDLAENLLRTYLESVSVT